LADLAKVEPIRETHGVTFAVPASSYDRYMGRYSRPLARELIAFAAVEPGMRALDVGCGPGALAAALAGRLGADHVAAADPSEALLAACAERVPGADVKLAPAERLPWPDASFDVALSQLVLNFVGDAETAVGEMRRVVRPNGLVASCTWDYAGGMVMLRTFWDAALELDPAAPDEGPTMRYCTEPELVALWQQAGLADVETGSLQVEVTYEDFDDYWEPFTLGIGPGGAYCTSLDDDRRLALRNACFKLLSSPGGSFTLPASAFAVRGRKG
jgi:ubiquinone/menaquinone biosynthesis C-methylase UbiE